MRSDLNKQDGSRNLSCKTKRAFYQRVGAFIRSLWDPALRQAPRGEDTVLPSADNSGHIGRLTGNFSEPRTTRPQQLL